MGTSGYPADSPGYPLCDGDDDALEQEGEEGEEADDLAQGLDLERFLPPGEAAKLMTADQPIAHDGKAGWAVERATGRARWLGGEPQYDVMARPFGSRRDEPGLTDVPAHGGLPEPAPDDAELRAAYAESKRKRVQIGLKLTPAQAIELEEAAELFGVTRTTLARLLVVRGVREVVARAKDSPP